MAASKKPHFPAPPILNIFSWKFHGLVLGLVELVEMKEIGVAQLICNSSKSFLDIFTIWSVIMCCQKWVN